MVPMPLPTGPLSLDELPDQLRHALHALANAYEKYGADPENASDAAFIYGTWGARALGLWPAVVDEVHGVRV